METIVLQAKDKKESRLLIDMLTKMKIEVMHLSKEEQEDFFFGKLLKDAIKQGEAKSSSIEKIINKFR
jgi:hypothetical protein